MKPLIVVSVFGAAALLGLPAGAQTAFPAPYAPPVPPQYQQMPRVQDVPPEGAGQAAPEGEDPGYNGQPGPDVPPPPANEAPPPDQQPTAPAYDPNNLAVPGAADPNAANYPPVDLAPDNEIAQSYDDGYDPQAYSQFQTSLAPYGAWDYDSSYGYVWSPSVSVVGAGFVPYANNGHWVMSEYGWTWVSDWNWGWAPFHYGRWVVRGGRGWSWVPGTMWGPAWVSWRSGNGYVGWSPLPPRGMHLAAAYGAGSPWRFTRAASLGALHPAFYSPRYLPGLFARTSVVSNDRLLSHGRWNVHVNAGPSRGMSYRPVSLSTVAPHVLPRVAIYPHAGTPLSDRPWTRIAAQNDVLNSQGWHAGDRYAQPRAFGRAPTASPAARPEIRSAAGGGWSRPAAAYGSSPGSYGRPYGNNGWTAPTTRPAYGAAAPMGYGAAAPAYRPAYQPQPSYHAPAAAYQTSARTYSPAPRSFSPPAGSGFQSGGGFSHSGGFSSAGGSHFGGGGGGAHFGGGGGGRRR
ncbi:MAG TPA: DUF6600 domain-containing protein [Polyangia bacterium]|nr:DUF6600 domain-containing protein [Polyangia bacterium]